MQAVIVSWITAGSAPRRASGWADSPSNSQADVRTCWALKKDTALPYKMTSKKPMTTAPATGAAMALGALDT